MGIAYICLLINVSIQQVKFELSLLLTQHEAAIRTNFETIVEWYKQLSNGAKQRKTKQTFFFISHSPFGKNPINEFL